MLSSWTLRSRVRLLTIVAVASFAALLLIMITAFQVVRREQAETMDNAQLAYAAKTARSLLLDINNSGRTFFYTGAADAYAEFDARSEQLVDSLRALRATNPNGPADMVLDEFFTYQNETYFMLDLRIQLGITRDLGLEGELRRHARALEASLRKHQDPTALYNLMILRGLETDFMLRRDDADAVAHKARRDEVSHWLETASLTAGARDEALRSLEAYARAFDAWVAMSRTMLKHSDRSRTTFGVMLDQLSDYADAKDAARASANARLHEIVSQTGLVALCAVAFFIALSLYLMRIVGDSIANPIKRIADDMLAMCDGRTSADQTFHRLPTNEIADLQAIMVFFRESLAESEMLHDEIRYHRDNLKSEVARRTMELEQQTVRLEQSLAREQQVNQLQNQIVSTVSHEFRTPLAIIDGAARRVIKKSGELSSEDISQRMDNIRQAVNRLAGLVERTLDSAKMASGRMEYTEETVDLAGLVREVVSRHAEFAPDFTFDVDVAKAPETIKGDHRLLDHIIANLVSNAIKYSRQRPHVIVTMTEIEGDAVLSVKDHGVGIPRSELAQVASRFFRASTSAGIPGTGIGLNLVSQLVDMHGGRMRIESVEGEWTEFVVRLPVEGPGDAATAEDEASEAA